MDVSLCFFLSLSFVPKASRKWTRDGGVWFGEVGERILPFKKFPVCLLCPLSSSNTLEKNEMNYHVHENSAVLLGHLFVQREEGDKQTLEEKFSPHCLRVNDNLRSSVSRVLSIGS